MTITALKIALYAYKVWDQYVQETLAGEQGQRSQEINTTSSPADLA